MELQRYEMGDYCSGYVPNDDGEVCMSYDVQRLEESHAELLEALKWALANINCEPYEWSDEEDVDAHEAARAAIAKAEGTK